MLTPILLVSAALLQTPDPQAPTAPEAMRPPIADSHIANGLALYRRLRLRAARDEFQKAVEADPSSAAAHFYLGYTLYKIGEPTRRMSPEKVLAREHFERAFELDPEFRPVWSGH